MDASDTDAGSSRRCAPDDEIISVERVVGLNDDPFQCCAVFGDPGTVYYSAGLNTNGSSTNLYRMTLSDRDVFEGRIEVLGQDTEEALQNPTLSRDGLSIYYDRRTPEGLRVYGSFRHSVEQEFGQGREIDLGGGALEPDRPPEWDPFLTDDGLFFTRVFAVNFAERAGDGFVPGESLAEVSGTAMHPVASEDGRALYWASARPNDTPGAFDIWVATREGAGEPYGLPKEVPGADLNTAFDEFPSWESRDGCDLYFSTNRNGGRREIFVGRREPRPAD